MRNPAHSNDLLRHRSVQILAKRKHSLSIQWSSRLPDTIKASLGPTVWIFPMLNVEAESQVANNEQSELVHYLRKNARHFHNTFFETGK